MPVIKAFSSATLDVSSLTLPRYAQIIRYDETAFFGINKSTDRERDVLRIWQKLDRDMVARYLGEAQGMIENRLGYPIGEKWFSNEDHHNTRWFFTRWSRLRSLGVRAVAAVATGVALNHTADPATLPATATTVTDADELHFYQTGTDVEVYPSAITLSGGNVSASFPRARLVAEAFQDNPDTGLDYNDTTVNGPYIQALDIKRIYTDTTDVGVFVWPLGNDCSEECEEDTKPACGYIRSNESGVISLLPQTQGDCFWTGASEIRVNYCAGKPLDAQAEDAIMHLAHALMPTPPCAGSDPISMLWKQDQFTPEVLTRARIDCPFGVHEGAWRAWTYCQANKHMRITHL